MKHTPVKRYLHFHIRGEYYLVNEAGEMKQESSKEPFSGEWIFLGGSTHHWRKGYDVPLSVAFEYPKLLNGCLLWDKNHGTMRQWGGNWYGRLPRICNAYIKEAGSHEEGPI